MCKNTVVTQTIVIRVNQGYWELGYKRPVNTEDQGTVKTTKEGNIGKLESI